MTTYQSELQRQSAAYADIRSRLLNPGPTKREFEKMAARVSDLERELEEEKEKNLSLSSRILYATQVSEAELAKERTLHERLQIDHSDLQAAYMEQVERLGNVEDAIRHQELLAAPRKTVAEIVAAVLADYPDVTWEQVKSQRRHKALVETRRACMRAVYEQRPDLSTPAIGRIFARDHTTIMYSVGMLDKKPKELR